MRTLLFFLAVSILLMTQVSYRQAANNEEIVTKFFDLFNNHEWTKMAEMYSEIAEFKDPSFGPGTHKMTRQATAKKYAKLNRIFPDLHDEIIAIYTNDKNVVVVEFVSTGTAADGDSFTLPICTIFTIEGGLITKDYTYYDNSN